MCGITGVVRGRDAGIALESIVEKMVCTLEHRGPDDRGVWVDDDIALGHTRLSIIDLSARGRQPMEDASRRYIVAFNGEIYNYVEVRAELEALGHEFRTQTDTEVLLEGFAHWGSDVLPRLNGMWAFAIWDRHTRSLFAARDRVGKKPLYYHVDETGALRFASEIRALRAVGVPLRLNAQAGFDFLTQGTYGHLEGESFFADVRQLPAGHFLVAKPSGAFAVERYWDLPRVSLHKRVPYDEAFRHRFRRTLTDAVALRLRSDVPVGATLSGGLDSSTIVLLMDQLGRGEPIHLFTSLYPGTTHDETPYFDAVVERLARPVVHRVTPDTQAWPDLIGRVLDAQEEPFGDTAILAHYCLMEAARREGVPVILGGQGGDELLFGYPSMVNAYLGHLLSRGALGDAWREVRAWSQGSKQSSRAVVGAALAHAIPLSVRDKVRRHYVARLAAIVAPGLRAKVSFDRFTDDPLRGSLDSYIAQVFKRFALPHLTQNEDRNSMAFAVETRMPFLDYRLIELVFAADYSAAYHDGLTKRVLREAFSDLLPEAILRRRDKIGFYTPLAMWMRANVSWIRSTLQRDQVESLGVVNWPRLERRIAELVAGDNGAQFEVWRSFILHLWASRFGVDQVTRTDRGTSRLAA